MGKKTEPVEKPTEKTAEKTLPDWRSDPQYTPELADRMVEFFRSKKFMAGTNFPTIEEFAASEGILSRTLHSWIHSEDENGHPIHPELYRAYEVSMDHVQLFLINAAMRGVLSNALQQQIASGFCDFHSVGRPNRGVTFNLRCIEIPESEI